MFLNDIPFMFVVAQYFRLLIYIVVIYEKWPVRKNQHMKMLAGLGLILLYFNNVTDN